MLKNKKIKQMKSKVKDKTKGFLLDFLGVLKRPEMAILPGHLAFFFVLAIVPTLTLITYGATFLNLSTDLIYSFISRAFSKDIANLILNTSNLSMSGFSLAILIIIGYYVASNGSASIIITSNAIYGEEQTSFLKRRIKALIMTFFLVMLFIFILIVPLFGDSIIKLVKIVNLNNNVFNNISKGIKLLQGPITWLIIYLFIKLLYTIAPNQTIKSKSVGYGAIFTSIGWILATAIYSFYINHYGHYTTIYGGLANIVILMLWFYLLALIFTIGMALNYRKEELEKTTTLKIKK